MDLIARPGTPARQELERVAGIATALIAGEAMRTSPVVVHGVGPRLRVYYLYDEEAILGEGASEEALAWCPTDGDWAMSLPCPPEDLDWVTGALARASKRVTARDVADDVPSPGDSVKRRGDDDVSIDREAFLRP